jgi:hypothetical protein
MAEQDVVKSYGQHCNAYIVKPVDLDNFKEVVRTIERFFFLLVITPDDEDDE